VSVTFFILPLAQVTGANASSIFLFTVLFIFVTAVITTVLTKWSRDKCLKFFHHYHVTFERNRGQTTWGRLRVFSSGIELVYDHPYIDSRGQKKTSYMIYQQEMEQQMLSLLRYHDELEEDAQQRRQKQAHKTFNPGRLKRGWRGVRNLVNTLRDAFNAAFGAVVGQYQRMNPASAIATTQAGSVTTIGQTLISKFANAFEPLLEQYIGQPVILDVADPLNPNNATVQYAGYLADYTMSYIAIFNVEHQSGDGVWVSLPDLERGDPLPPLPVPPPPFVALPALPPPMKSEHNLAIRMDGRRIKIMNESSEPVVVRRLEREGFEPLELGMVIPSNGTLDLPARDARGGKLFVEAVRCLDVIAPRKYATIRHAGQLVDRPGIMEQLEHGLDRLPLVPKLFRNHSNGDDRE
jgi:hypothetical protein